MKEKVILKLREIYKNKGVYIIIAPFFLLFFFFCVIPAIMLFTTAFTDYKAAGVTRFTGLQNFRVLFGYEDFKTAFINNLSLAAVTGVTGLAASFLLAWFTSLMPRFLRFIFIFAILAPMFTGGLYAAREIIFSEYLIVETTPFMQAVIMRLPLSFGLGFLALVAGMRQVPRERYEAAAVEGIRNRFSELIKITVPAIKPQILFAVVLQIVTAFAADEVRMPLETVMTRAYEHSTSWFDFGTASAACLLLFGIMAGVYVLVRLLFREVFSE